MGLFRRTPSLLLAAGLTLFLTFLVGEAVPNTLFQILEIIEILLIGDPDTGFLQALVLVETIDGLRERLQTQVARLVDQPRHMRFAHEVGNIVAYGLFVVDDVIALDLDQQPVVDQIGGEAEIHLVTGHFGASPVVQDDPVIICRKPVGKLVGKHLQTRCHTGRSTDIGTAGIAESTQCDQRNELLRLGFLRIEHAGHRSLHFYICNGHDHAEIQLRVAQTTADMDLTIDRHRTVRNPGTALVVVRRGGYSVQQRLQRRFELIDGIDVEPRIDRLARPLNHRTALDDEFLRNDILQ